VDRSGPSIETGPSQLPDLKGEIGTQIAEGQGDRIVRSRWAHRSAWLGILLTAAIAAASIGLASLPWLRYAGVSALTIAVVLGITVGNTVFPRFAKHVASGVDLSKSTLLRAGIVLYGFRITFQQIAGVGWGGVLIDALIVVLTFGLAVVLGLRVFKLDRQTVILVGAGSAICGATAIVATEPVVRGQPHKVAAAIATVVVFGTLAMFLYPELYPHLAMSEQAYGIFVGSTVHEVAHVVAAARSVSEPAETSAIVEKMLRVMMLAPFLVLLSGATRRERLHAIARGAHPAPRARPWAAIPWFAVLFVAASGVSSLHLLEHQTVLALGDVDALLLGMAMAALGLRTHASALREAGVRPLLLAAVLFVFLSVGGYLINRGVHGLLG